MNAMWIQVHGRHMH